MSVARQIIAKFRRNAFTFAALALSTQPAAAEARSYVIEWFSLASYSQEGDCPGGVNPTTREQYVKDLALLGKSQQEIDEIMKQYTSDFGNTMQVRQMMIMRGRVDGKPVNAFMYPWTSADPHLHSVVGKYAFGFDLDGKAGANSFEDPMTHQTGVDNQLFRAVGCIAQFRGTYTARPTFWDTIWGSLRVSAPAWLMSVTGDHVDRDGPVTITFDRAIEHLTFDPTGEATADATYRIDPDPRSHHSFKGEIKNGVLSVTEPGSLSLMLDTISFTELRLHQTHLRLTQKPNGNLEGLLGGYQPWNDIYFSFAQGGLAYEGMLINDIPGTWYLLRRMADAEPDPKTGQNMAISAAYHIEAVPVFAVPEGTGTYVVPAK